MSARDRRVLIVGVVAIGGLVATTRGLPILMQWQSEKIAEANGLAVKREASRLAALALPRLRDSLASRRQRLSEFDSAFVGGVTLASAASELASIVDGLADDANVKVSAMQLRADTAAKSQLGQVGVRVTAVSDIYGMMAFLRAVDGGEALLAVRELAVTQPDPAGSDSKPETLRFEVVIEGLARLTPGVPAK